MKEVLILDSFDRYAERTKYVKRAFESFGYKVNIIQSDFCHVTKKYVEDKNPDVIYVNAKSYTKNLSVKRILSHLDIAKKMIKKAEEFSPDIVYCMLPVNSIAKRVKKYAKKKGARLFFDIFDLWPESMPIGNAIIKKLLFPWKKMRDKYLPCAEKVFLECNLYKKYLPKCDNFVTAYLCKGENARQLQFNHDDKLRFLYLGSMNNLIDIDAILDFLNKVKDREDIEFYLVGGGEKKDEFLAKLTEQSINFVDYGMVFDEKQKDEIISRCHFGLNIYKENTTIGLTLKSMDYFCRSLPIITKGIVDTGLICNEYDCGVSIDKEGSFDKSIFDQLNEDRWTKLCQNSLKAYDELFTYDSFLKTLSEVVLTK